MRSQEEWESWCKKITKGYSPGGVKVNTYKSGIAIANFLLSLNISDLKSTILDVGSGNGRLPMGLYAAGYTGNYTGIDIILPSVRFCQDAFREFPNYKFHHLDLKSNHYWPKGSIYQAQVGYPIPDKSIDLVTCFSLFSHTGTVLVVYNTLKEMKRVLKPTGRIFTTWYFGTTPVEEEKKTTYDFNDIAHIFTVLEFTAEKFEWPMVAEDRMSDQTIYVLGLY